MTEESDFLEACKAFNCSKVKEYLDGGVDINVRVDGYFALKYAARARLRIHKDGKRLPDLQLLEILLACPSIDVNNKDDKGRTALMEACTDGNQKVVERLLSVPGLDINHRDHHGWTALLWASAFGGEDNIEMLLAVPGIDINCQDNHGRTAMMLAVALNNLPIKIFVPHDGINWNMKNNLGRDIFTIALIKNKPSINFDLIAGLFSIPSWRPDVSILRKMNVYEEAAALCSQFVSNKMRSMRPSGINYPGEVFSDANLYAFAFAHGMKNIATVLNPDQDEAVESCRLLIAETMSNDGSLHPQNNMTEMVYALKKGMDDLALVLTSGVKVVDILLLCKIFQFEQDKLILASEAQTQETMENSVPSKRRKLE